MDRPGGENILPASKKTQAVFAFLCLSEGDRLLRSRVAGLIWDRSTERQARDSLRHALKELAGLGNWRLETDAETVRLDVSRCWIDAFDSPTQADLLLDDLYGVSASFDQWLIGARVRFENRWQAELEEKLNSLIAKKEPPELRAAAARKLLNFVPAHELGVRSLMTAFMEMGDRAQAVREYERFRLLIEKSHGMLPSDDTVVLYETIRLEARGNNSRAAMWTGRPEGSARRTSVEEPDIVRVEPTLAARRRDLGASIAVLPFRNLSADVDHDYVALGLTDDAVEVFSRVPSLFVVSRLSSAAFSGQARPPSEIGGALGVRYVLSGSVRVSGERLRLIVELTDAIQGTALWTSRFEEKFGDLLDVQDRLAEKVVRTVAPHVHAAELKRVRVKRPEQYDAYDLLLRAQENMHSASRAVFESSEQLFDAAIGREPRYAAAHAWRAYWHVMRVGQGWSPDPSRDTAQADYFGKQAIECDPADPMALAVQGHIAAFLHRNFELAFSCFESALQINPNSARAWLWNANAHAWIGEGADAVWKVNRAMALSPYDPLVAAFSGGASIAYLADGQYARAIEFALRCIRENRGYTSAYKLLILGLALVGRENEARTPVHQLLLLEPDFTVQRYRDRFPGRDGPLVDRFCDALSRAGVPLSG